MDELVIQDALTWFLEQNILQLRQIKICRSRNNGRLKDREYARDTLRGRVFAFHLVGRTVGIFIGKIFLNILHILCQEQVLALQSERIERAFLF